jgi:hypothetical protein
MSRIRLQAISHEHGIHAHTRTYASTLLTQTGHTLIAAWWADARAYRDPVKYPEEALALAGLGPVPPPNTQLGG